MNIWPFKFGWHNETQHVPSHKVVQTNDLGLGWSSVKEVRLKSRYVYTMYGWAAFSDYAPASSSLTMSCTAASASGLILYCFCSTGGVPLLLTSKSEGPQSCSSLAHYYFCFSISCCTGSVWKMEIVKMQDGNNASIVLIWLDLCSLIYANLNLFWQWGTFLCWGDGGYIIVRISHSFDDGHFGMVLGGIWALIHISLIMFSLLRIALKYLFIIFIVQRKSQLSPCSCLAQLSF